MGIENPKFEKSPEINKENFEEVQEVNFEDLNKEDKLVIYTANKTDGGWGSVYIVDVDRIRKTKDGEIKHLDVTFKEIERQTKKAIEKREKFLTRISEDDEEMEYLKALNLPEEVGEYKYGWAYETPDELVAKMPGGYETLKKEYKMDYLNKEFDKIPKKELDAVGETRGIIKTGENNHLHLNNINYKNRFEETKSGKRRELYAGSSRSAHIRKILLFRKEEEK